MANVAEDESAKLIHKPYPRCGEKWQHITSGLTVEVWRLCIGFWGLSKNLEQHVYARCDFKVANEQNVIYIEPGEYYCIRTVENFLERFERVG